MSSTYSHTGLIDWRSTIDQSPPTMLEWTESEIKIPDGPFQGLSFRRDRQPVLGLLLAEYGKSLYSRYAVTGCTQSGKSLCAFVLPVLYHVFCLGETICAGVPHQDMAVDKWQADLLPVCEGTRYAELMPRQGSGSRGGKLNSVRFRNGATIRFLSAAGGDKSRAGFTSRALACTEVDGYDHMAEKSDESDKVTQMEGRLLAYGPRARTYLECTVSTEEGRIWQEYLHGTKSAFVIPCPECGEYITMERGNLVGWQDAPTEGAATREARWCCLTCGGLFDDAARAHAHLSVKLIHDGQKIDRHGNITGESPDTRTFSCRWSAGNNLFLPAGFIAAHEWKAVRDVDQDSAERKMCQQFWTIPPPPPKLLDESITIESVEQKAQGYPRGLVPEWATVVTMGVDIGKHICHWTAQAWGPTGNGQIINYGVMDTNATSLGEEVGIESALERINELGESGWTRAGSGLPVPFDAGGVDSGGPGWAHIIYKFCKRHPKWAPTKGFGTTNQGRKLTYRQPKSTGTIVLKIGDGYHWAALARPRGQRLLEFDSDQMKSFIHARLQTPDGQPGTLRIFGHPSEHLQFSKHLTAEQEVHDKKLGVARWVVLRPNANHFFDSTVLGALIARTRGIPAIPSGGVNSAPAQKEEQPAKPQRPRHTMNSARRIRAKY